MPIRISKTSRRTAISSGTRLCGGLPRPTAWLIGVLLLILLAGFGRMRWAARPGSEEFAASLHTLGKATVGHVVDLRTPAEAHPDDQLAFWRSEIDRILAEHPDDAELHAAAAVMLAESSLLYVSQLTRDVAGASSSAPGAVSSQVFAGIRQTRSRFDTEGGRKSRQSIRRATELDPEDPRWWRLRAILMWPSALTSQGRQPREPNWEQVLEAARQHDPGNALYPLLHAYRAGEEAIELDENVNFVVGDPEAWQQTIEYARECAVSPHLTLGEPAMQGLVRLHSLSRHPTATTTESIRARFVASRVAHDSGMLVRDLLRMADAKEIRKERALRAELLSLAQQLNETARERSDKVVRYASLTVGLRQSVWQARKDFEQEQGEVSAETAAKLDEAARWRAAVEQAATELGQQQKPNSAGTVNAVASTIALSLFAPSLAVALVLLAIWLIGVRSAESLRLTGWPFALFACGVGISLLFLGAGPARLVSETVQHWILTGLSFAILLSLLGALAVRSRLRLRFSIRSLLIGCAAVAVLLQTAVQLQLGWEALGLPIRAHAAPAPLLDAVQQQNPQALDQWLPGPDWVSRSVMQWLMHEGAAWSVAIFLALALIVLVWRASASRSFGELAVAATVLAMLWLSVWVWLEPRNYVSARRTQMRYEAYIRSIDEYYEPFEESLDRILREQQRATDK